MALLAFFAIVLHLVLVIGIVQPSVFKINSLRAPTRMEIVAGYLVGLFVLFFGCACVSSFGGNKNDTAAVSAPIAPIVSKPESNTSPVPPLKKDEEDEETKVKAGSTIRFVRSGIACDEHDTLVDAMMYGADHNLVKLNKLFKPSSALGNPHCLILNDKLEYKVMTVEQHEGVGFSLIEIKLPDFDMKNGLWATDVGIVIVKSTK